MPTKGERNWQGYEEFQAEYRFWLVQRLIPVTNRSRTGFNQLFELDYMGRAEFEFGEVPKALRSMRDNGTLCVTEVTLTSGGTERTVYFVSYRDGLPKKLHDFREWFDKGCYPSCELTYFIEQFRGGGPRYINKRVTAWWSLHEDLAWTLDKDVAQRLLRAFNPCTD